MLTYADVCGRMLTYADVCGRMRERATGRGPVGAAYHCFTVTTLLKRVSLLTYADVTVTTLVRITALL